jgi:hypothetical protein
LLVVGMYKKNGIHKKFNYIQSKTYFFIIFILILLTPFFNEIFFFYQSQT